MAKLTAEMVIDLRDNTGRATQTVIGNLSRLKRAERELDLANKGMRLTRQNRAQEALMIAQAAEKQEQMSRFMSMGAVGFNAVSLAAAVAGTAAVGAYVKFAGVERQMNRIAVNAGKGADAIRPAMGQIQQVAGATHQSFETVTSGLETLIASGRTLDEAMSFLPSVAVTAQASGSEIADIALSADALSSSMGIASGEMQKAFDILVGGGKLGKFELKDMAQYLPSLAPAFASLGYKGTDGLKRLVAALQVVRNQTGSSSEAATLMSNVLNKMYTADTAKKFKDMGINLPKALDRARAEGKDMLTVFLELSNEAVHGDLSKLPLLFTDAQMLQGVRALITGSQQLRQNLSELDNVDGSTLKDFNQIASDSTAKIQDLSNAWDRFALSAGAKLSDYVTPVLDKIARTLDEMDAKERAVSGKTPKVINEDKADFIARWKELRAKDKGAPGGPMGGYGLNLLAQKAYEDALAGVGRGEAPSIFTSLEKEAKRQKMLDLYIDRGKNAAQPGARVTPTNGRPSLGVRRGLIPVPIPRPDPNAPSEEALNAQGDFPNRSFRANDITPYHPSMEYKRRMRAALRSAPLDSIGMAGMPYAQSAPAGPQAVTLSGPVVTQPSGVQKVEMVNPTRPNVTINVTVPVQQTNGDPHAIGQGVGSAIADQISGSYSDIGN